MNIKFLLNENKINSVQETNNQSLSLTFRALLLIQRMK